MKGEFSEKPEAVKAGWDRFPWKEMISAVPSPLFVVTTYKANGKPNACLQSWATFFGDTGEFLCIMPRIVECFLNLECDLLWEKLNFDNSGNVTMCVRVKHVAMDSEHYAQGKSGRYGKNGFLYNVHGPTDPETGKVHDDSLGILEVARRMIQK